MSSEYKDRGILKWAPFECLSGHGTMLEQLIYNMNKKQKAELSDDQYEELNSTISKAAKDNKPIQITYYNDGYTYDSCGRIEKVDTINRNIKLDTGETIEFDFVLQIKILR